MLTVAIFQSEASVEFVVPVTESSFLISSFPDLSAMLVPLVAPTSCSTQFLTEPAADFSTTGKLAPYENDTASLRL